MLFAHTRHRWSARVIAASFLTLAYFGVPAEESARAAEGDKVITLVAPKPTCVPGPANDLVDLTATSASGSEAMAAGAIDIVPTSWMDQGDGSALMIVEVYLYDQGWTFTPDSWRGGDFFDYGDNCGQEPELVVMPTPTPPGTTPDDPTKKGDVQWTYNESEAVWGYTADGRLIASAFAGRYFEIDGQKVFDIDYGFPPDVYDPPTSGDPATPPDNGGGTGDSGNGGDNGGSTPPASTPDTSVPNAGGQVPTSGSNDKSGADTSKDGKKSTNTTSQIRRPGHNGAVSRDVVAYTGAGYENNVPADGFVLFALAGVGLWLSRRRASSI